MLTFCVDFTLIISIGFARRTHINSIVNSYGFARVRHLGLPFAYFGFAWVRHLLSLLLQICVIRAFILGSPGCAICAFWVCQVRHLGSPGAHFAILGSPGAPFGFTLGSPCPSKIHFLKMRTLGSPNLFILLKKSILAIKTHL